MNRVIVKRGKTSLVLRAIGVFGIVMSIALMFTVIGIIPGLAWFSISSAIHDKGKGLGVMSCKECGKSMSIRSNAQNTKCSKCKTFYVVDWS